METISSYWQASKYHGFSTIFVSLFGALGSYKGTDYSTEATTPVAGAIFHENVVEATDKNLAVASLTFSNGTCGVMLDPNYQSSL